MKKGKLIFVPAPGIGHLVCTIEFANTLIQRDPQLFITVLVIKPPFTGFIDPYMKSLTLSQPNIHLIYLPEMELPPLQLFNSYVESFVCAFIDSHMPIVNDIITEIMLSAALVVGLVVDFFCVSMVDIGDKLGIPSFIFMTSGAGFMNLMLYLPSHHEQFGKEFSFSDSEISIPGFVNVVPPSVLPEAVLNKNGGYDAFIQLANKFKHVKSIIVNTFNELEYDAIDESCKNDNKNPKVYPVGPLLNLKGHPHPELDHSEWDTIRKWLDDQVESSVVFLCFGSGGSFDADQVKEIAIGLEKSGHKFLWSMRVSPLFDQDLKNPKEMLPEGFLERVKGRGMITGWAPQVEVLGHKAIGGFVSHCGWNSVLESLWFGVPIATLPIFAEQQLNAFTLVKELGITVDLKSDYRRNIGKLESEEVEKGVRSVMNSENERKKVKNMSRISRMVGLEGGS